MTTTLPVRTPASAAVAVTAVTTPPRESDWSDAGTSGAVLSFPAMDPRSTRGSVVVAAVDNDGNPATVISYAAACARELGVPLRVAYVWSAGDIPATGTRMPDADLMLAGLLYDCAADGGGNEVERELLHDHDPAAALVALSHNEATLMVVSASSSPRTPDRPLGDTVRALAGRTGCPLLVVVPDQPIDPQPTSPPGDPGTGLT
ncbi:universal stress protein [Actinoplanes xinjiangensis]|uniref:universal stress protein n=1 Tax=Actinoplanes xinjiangensis TaxID=512350 RepID=UPI003439DC4A